MATLKNTTITGTGHITSLSSPTASRVAPVSTIIQWTNTGSQSYSVLAGTTPTLSNTTWTCPTGVNSIEVLVVAGGGGGGPSGPTSARFGAGGGGAGGLIYNQSFSVSPGTQYTVTVGTGGSGAQTGTVNGTNGSNSVFSSLTAIGGGGGGYDTGPSGANGSSGGSGGGGAPANGTGGAGTAGQGFAGGTNYGSSFNGGGGGGGAGARGSDGRGTYGNAGGGGGIGLNFNISGTATYYAGGGGAGVFTSGTPGKGGLGGGGDGGALGSNGNNATASTGGGGGGASGNSGSTVGGNGASGIVIIRYNVSSDNTQPESSLRYNSEIRTLELNNVGTSGWTGQNSTRNFGGHNLITYSQTFGSGHTLSNVTVASSNNLAPDGTSTASYIVEDTTPSTFHEFFASFATASSTSGTYTYSIYAKAGTRNWIALRLGNSSTSSYSFINLSTGAVGTISGHTNVTATSVGNGWYRCSVTRDTTLGSSSQFAGVRLATGDGTQSYTGQGTSYGVYLWGSQVELGSTAGPYVYTNGVASPIPTSLGGYRTHTYTTTGTSGFSPAHSGLVEVLVVAGGGQGGNITGGGGGGLIYNTAYPVISGKQYAVTVGAGGTTSPGSNAGQNGSNSTFGPLTAIGGGGGAGSGSGYSGFAGGSGGGGGGDNGTNGSAGGAVSTQGNPGGTSLTSGTNFGGGGGGGAGGPGNNAFTNNVAGYGGSGRLIDISGTPTYYAAGGGGGAYIISSTGTRGLGGSGIGGNGGQNGTNATNGTANTGSGGGGNGLNSSGNLQGSAGTGGSGIVIVRYRYD